MKILIRIALGLLLFACLSASAGCEAIAAQFTSPSERYRLEGERLLEDGRTAEAIMALRAAIDSDTANLPAVKRLSQLYAGQGRLRLALRLLARTLALFPQDADLNRQSEQISQSLAANTDVSPQWVVDLGSSEPVGFSGADARLFISMDDGAVLAIDPAGGKVLWNTMLPSQASAAPAVTGGQVWVGGQDGVLYTLSAADGSLQWKFATQAPLYAPPAVSETTVYLAAGDGKLYALERAGGALRWSFPTGGPLHAQPTLAEGVLYFGSTDAHLYALDAVSGRPLWANGILTQGAVESQAVVSDGRVFFGSGDSRVYALAVATGGEYWRFSTPDAIYAAPLLYGEDIIAASAGGALIALQKITGKPTWSLKTGAALSYPPVVYQNRLFYVASGQPTLFSVDAITGAALPGLNTGDWFSAGPLILDHSLYLLSKAGYLLAYPLS